MATSVQVREAKLPISQKIMTPTCSSARYFRKLIPADRIAATIMPDRTRLVDDNPPLPDARKTTSNNVPAAPTNAKSGTE